MRPRTLAATLKKVVKTFPAVVVTGPRQSGKTTLLRSQFSPSHRYLSLENPDVRLRAKEDPIGFLSQLVGKIILDEIQYVPELLPYIKSSIDDDRTPGRFLLTGSQNFALMHGVSESLAGRAAILTLLPFSLAERMGNGVKALSVERLVTSRSHPQTSRWAGVPEIIVRGNYPEIAYNVKIDRDVWCGSYITTYLERDIRNIAQVGDLGQFEIFLRACAARTGQLLDLSSLAREIGVSFTTAKRWLSLLETGHQVILLRPYYKNIGKRLVKRPKLYFMDTGIASYLLGINTPEILMGSSYFGPLFETLVVTDFLKRFYCHGQIPSMYYLRTHDDLEVDLVIEGGRGLTLIEIKSSATITKEHASSLIRAKRDLGDLVENAMIISQSNNTFPLHSGILNFSALHFLPR